LALSFGIIQEHAGRILVDGKVGSGTRFTIKFPAAAIGWPVYQKTSAKTSSPPVINQRLPILRHPEVR
jgi:hypothetical protein